MTDTALPNQRERLQRTLALWNKSPELSQQESADLVDAEMAVEQAQQDEIDERSRQMAASFEAMMSCPACGGPSGSGLCAPCSAVAATIRAERAAVDQVHGYGRRWLVEQFLDRSGS